MDKCTLNESYPLTETQTYLKRFRMYNSFHLLIVKLFWQIPNKNT